MYNIHLVCKISFNFFSNTEKICEIFLGGIFSLARFVSHVLRNKDFIYINCQKNKINLRTDHSDIIEDKSGEILIDIIREILVENDYLIDEKLMSVNIKSSISDIFKNLHELKRFKFDREFTSNFLEGILFL